ncbi:hypothetical protein HMPREF9080_02306 [Cardiobacterium valvarum F0432]|uniref:Uncharacterized protein n=1 Tax=Cardiobacterium valvarum F0432 TaxID=797473 RepID=G9ZHP8_9GAMM|nr:hypothetical protein HMPREF9080_02306 [Cardiobacterium valvarum F0432]
MPMPGNETLLAGGFQSAISMTAVGASRPRQMILDFGVRQVNGAFGCVLRRNTLFLRY